ncbi:DUF2634 domain-containing protein [Lactococcus petauri]|uniref:DUF2634 domain-containing protein n=1 Tax=Lactococcus TaxID=1357 RepID=UPI00254C3856|nr:DUF2634 domain-containing protein [Lactococcus garvieae]
MEKPITEDIKQEELEGNQPEPVIESSLTYKVENGRILGRIDSLEAVHQAVIKILLTDRFVFEIYSDQYGNDLNDLIGNDIPFVKTAVENVIKEALLSDDRIDDVTIDSVEQTDRQTLSVFLTVSTLFGNFEIEKEVKA